MWNTERKLGDPRFSNEPKICWRHGSKKTILKQQHIKVCGKEKEN
jgi:hypothetical protein